MEKVNIKKLLEMSIEEREIEIFNVLRQIDVSEHVEKLNQNNIQLSYLSWAWAFDTVQQLLPVSYEIKHFTDEDGVSKPFMHDKDTGYIVETEITILGIKKSMWLPVMDSANRSMKHEQYQVQFKSGAATIKAATSFDINKTIMRCLVKNISLFGLGLYIYAGEDLPEKPVEYVTQEQIKEMEALKVKFDGVLQSYGIDNINLLKKSEAEFVIESKKKFLQKQAEKEKAKKGEEA